MRFVLPLLLVVLVASSLLFHVDKAAEESGLDASLCPADDEKLAASATFLLDLRKPLPEMSRPGALLHDLSLELDAGTELRIFALTGDADAPRQPVGRLCKPYANADLSVNSAKDQRRTFRDCDDLPAQLAPGLRSLAGRFCARRADLEERVNALATDVPASPIANAYLVEAFEETMLELAGRPGTPVFYIFSDMLQHAEWYSQLELGWTGWRFEDFAALRERHSAPFAASLRTNLRVRVFYVPRQNLTAPPRARRVHQAFWRAYFAGATLAFEDQAPLPTYAAVPLMNLPVQAESAVREREQLERQHKEAEQQLEAVAQRLGALKRQRQLSAEGTAERAARERELRRQEQVLEAERERPRDEEARVAAANAGAESPQAQLETPPAPPEVVAAPAPDRQAQLETSTAPPQVIAAPAPEEQGLPALAESAPCGLHLQPRFLDTLTTGRRYPGNRRVNYGDATIAVGYTIDEQGATEDDGVIVLRGRSSASDPQSFDALAEDTVEVVKSWEFTLEDTAEETCARRQQRTATFTYLKKCRGAPMPSCQTLLSEIEDS